MPAAKPLECRRRAVELARWREKPIAVIAADLGIAESCLRRWMKQDDVDAGRTEGLSTDERAERSSCAGEPGAGDGDRDPEAGRRLLREGGLSRLEMVYRLVHELAADGIEVAVAWRVLRVSRSGFYAWRCRPASARAVADEQLTATIIEVHHASRGTYGAPRVHAELRLGFGVACGRKRVARLFRTAGLAGVCHQRKHRRTGLLPAVHEDLVQCRFVADAPDRLWAWSPPASTTA